MQATRLETAAGKLLICWSDRGLQRIAFDCPELVAPSGVAVQWHPWEGLPTARRRLCRQLQAMLKGVPQTFDTVVLDLGGMTPFQADVIGACRMIEWGETCTYGELAARVGRPGAARAVGNVMRRNRVPLVVPCHRVVGRGGRLVGYSAPGGVELKSRLLRLEASTARR